MGLRIATNVPALVAQRNLALKAEETNRSIERLSSGSRISGAADDAAGLAISQNLSAETRSLQQAQRNAADGISVAQTAEGSLNEVSNILIRLRELSVQASSDTVRDEERGLIGKEFTALKSEVDRISKATSFNGRQLLDGSGGELTFQVGSHRGDANQIRFDPSQANASTSALGISGTGVESRGDAESNLESLDGAIGKVNSYRASLGSLQNRLQSAGNNLGVQVENLSEAHSRIADVDVAEESSRLARNNIQQNAAVSVLAQANQIPNSALKLL